MWSKDSGTPLTAAASRVSDVLLWNRSTNFQSCRGISRGHLGGHHNNLSLAVHCIGPSPHGPGSTTAHMHLHSTTTSDSALTVYTTPSSLAFAIDTVRPLLACPGAANRAEHTSRRQNNLDSQLKSEWPDECVFGPNFLTAVDSADVRGVVSGDCRCTAMIVGGHPLQRGSHPPRPIGPSGSLLESSGNPTLAGWERFLSRGGGWRGVIAARFTVTGGTVTE